MPLTTPYSTRRHISPELADFLDQNDDFRISLHDAIKLVIQYINEKGLLNTNQNSFTPDDNLLKILYPGYDSMTDARYSAISRRLWKHFND